jgi:hypothetical protein
MSHKTWGIFAPTLDPRRIAAWSIDGSMSSVATMAIDVFR